ncbi:hypothetical protein K402DRAFT_400793 [Aulographum hederae CBS 113979]|uniref:Serine-rich protein n=1 Tax=Aulographum hederae CBS 113979 TaxID=1176131 RepID=A0A6G1HBJ5_9PEZI|nr:hypothetical protein K402DRAFT_400793 [Aulographum hederae CBS 113979]
MPATPSSKQRLSQSPNRTPRSSPKRRPLHERSQSHTNEIASPSIRIVEDSDSPVYTKTPFPTHPAHVLLPSKAHGLPVHSQGVSVSDQSAQSNANPPRSISDALIPKPLQPRKSHRSSASTTNSDDETLANAESIQTSKSSRFSQATTPPVSPSTDDEQTFEASPTTSKDDLPVHSSRTWETPTIRPVIPSSPNESPSLPVNPSETSLSSSTSAGTLTEGGNAARESPDNSNYVVYPASSSDLPSDPTSPSPSRSKRATLALTSHPPSPPFPSSSPPASSPPQFSSPRSYPELNPSLDSLVLSPSNSSDDRPRSSSAPLPPTHAALHAEIESGLRVQYPTIRQPSASGSWAESSRAQPKKLRKSPRMVEQLEQHQWSSQLSTIMSESDRASQSLSGITEWSSDPSARLARRATNATATSSQFVGPPSSPDAASAPVPPPLFSHNATPPLDSSEFRESDERDDVVGELYSPPLRTVRSQRSFFSIFSSGSESRPSSSRPSSSRPSSQGDQERRDSLPTWARLYYRRATSSISLPETISEGDSRLNTAQSEAPSHSPTDEHFPTSIFRPRNRPNLAGNLGTAPAGGSSGDLIAPVPRAARPEDRRRARPESEMVERDGNRETWLSIGPNPRPTHGEPFTPRLQRDRRATVNVWRAPSFDESLSRLLFSKSNRQIALFCLGFIFPLAWILAAFLPLPVNPHDRVDATPSQLDVEQAIQRNLGPIDEKRYLKAQWWRNLNRIMSIAGILVIGAVVALAVIAVKMKNEQSR